MKRFISLLLIAVMILSLINTAVFAAEIPTAESTEPLGVSAEEAQQEPTPQPEVTPSSEVTPTPEVTAVPEQTPAPETTDAPQETENPQYPEETPSAAESSPDPVDEAPTIVFDPTPPSVMGVGDTWTFRMMFPVKWTALPEGIVEFKDGENIDEYIMTAAGVGTVTITATEDFDKTGKWDQFTLTVKNRFSVLLPETLAPSAEENTTVLDGDSFYFCKKDESKDYDYTVKAKDGTVLDYPVTSDKSGEKELFRIADIRTDIIVEAVEKAQPKLSLKADKSFITAGEKANLTAEFSAEVEEGKRTVTKWESNDETVATVENGVITPAEPFKPGDVTVTASSEDGLTAAVTVHVADVLSIQFDEEAAKVFEAIDKKTTAYDGDQYSFSINTADDKDCYTYTLKVGSSEPKEYPDKDGVITVKASGADAEKKLLIHIESKREKSFTSAVASATGVAASIILPAQQPTFKTDYVFEIRHYDDRKDFVLSDDNELYENGEHSENVYSFPQIQIDGKDYYGYKLTWVNTGDDEYKQYWKVKIPGNDIKGNITVIAERQVYNFNSISNFRKVSYGDIPLSNGTTAGVVPFGNHAGEQPYFEYVLSDAIGVDYYFYYVKDPTMYQELSCEGGFIERQGTGCVYKVKNLKAGATPATVTVSNSDTVKVIKVETPKHEEVLVETPTDTAKINTDYTFSVKWHELVIPNDLNITVTIGDLEFSALSLLSSVGREDYVEYMTWQRRSLISDYYDFTIKGQYITDDIYITASCMSPADRVRTAVMYTSSTNFKFLGEYPAANGYPGYKETTPSSQNRIEVPPYTPGGEKGFVFEIVNSSKNSKGKYYTDPNTDCYSYSLEGSTMGGRTLDATTPGKTFYYYYDKRDSDNTFHRMFYFTFDKITGDVVLNAKLILNSFDVSVIGGAKSKVKLIGQTSTDGTPLKNQDVNKAEYRRNYSFTATDVPKLIIRANGSKLNEKTGYTVTSDTYRITGGYIKGKILIEAMLDNEYEVTVTGENKDYIQITGDPIAGGGKNFVFKAFDVNNNYITNATIICGKKVLKKGTDYTVSSTQGGSIYTIKASSITDAITISASMQLKQQSTQSYSGGGGGNISLNSYVRTTTTTTSDGTDFNLSVSPFLRLSDGKTVYLITASGSPSPGYYPSYDGHKMNYSEIYEAYTWLTVDEMDPDLFSEQVESLFDDLTDSDLQHYANERAAAGIEEPDMSILSAGSGDFIAGDLDGDNEITSADVEIARKMYETADDNFEEYPLSIYLLADVNASQNIDMLDVTLIKYVAVHGLEEEE